MTTTTSSRATTAGARVATGAFSARSLLLSLPQAIGKLDPRGLVHNPVMFVVEIGAALTTVLAVADPTFFAWLIAVWLWLTVVFANLAEAVAEGRGRAQAASLRATRKDTTARRLGPDGGEERVAASGLRTGDLVVCESGDLVPGDGDVIEGVASVDESAITGESAPVIRESGGDRSAVTGGTRVLSDRIVVHITAEPGHTFIDRMIALVEGAARRKTPTEVALSVLLSTLTIIFLLAVATLSPFADYSGAPQSVVVLVALLVCLIPTTIGALLSAIGIAGMDRLVQRNVLAMSGRAVEAAGDVSTLLLDKTGTITFGNRQASELVAAPGVDELELARAAQLASLADETPEGRSIVILCKVRYGLREPAEGDLVHAEFVPFSAQTRMSGVDIDGRQVRKGAAEEVARWVRGHGGQPDPQVTETVEAIASGGGTPLVVASRESGTARLLGVVHLKDVVKDGIAERFAELRAMGIRTVMITGDNPRTAKAIAGEAGVDDFLAEATPEDKLALIRAEQEGGRLVAMTGDGTQRRARAGAGGRRRRDEHRNVGRQGGRQHGRPRLRPDQAHRHRRDRQAAADHPRGADDLLHRQRRGEVLRDHPGDVRRGVPRPRDAERHAPGDTRVGDPVRRRVQRAGHRRADPARAARGAVSPDRGRAAALAQPMDLRRGWPDCPVHRHKAHRPARLDHPGDRLTMTVFARQLVSALLTLLVLTVVVGVLTRCWSGASGGSSRRPPPTVRYLTARAGGSSGAH